MMFSAFDLQRLAHQHQTYLDRIIPVIRQRLAERGCSDEHIDRYVGELPSQHFATRIEGVLGERRCQAG